MYSYTYQDCQKKRLYIKKILTVHIIPTSRHRQAIFVAQDSYIFEAVLAQRFRHVALPACLQPHSLF